MAQPTRDHRVVIYGKDVREAVEEGSKEMYQAVASTYGPKGLNGLIEKPYGRGKLTRDGVSVAKEVYSKERAKNMIMSLIHEGSQTTNRLAGDGTTGTVALAYHWIHQGLELIAAGKDPMELRSLITKDANLLLSALERYTTEVSDKQLEHVATVSCGDPALGQLIAEAVEHVGMDGGIIAEKAYIEGVEREYIEGYYMQEGFQALDEGSVELADTAVVVTEKKISSNADFLDLIERVVDVTREKPPKIAFFGEIEGSAYKSIIANINQGSMNAVIVKTPSTGDMGVKYLEDIAAYCGGKILSAGDSIKSLNERNAEGKLVHTYIGRAERVVCTPYTTSIFGGRHDEKQLEARIDDLKQRIDTEESDNLVEKFRDRVAKLQGKIAVFKIGGATDTEKEEKEDRIEDAIQATRAAMAEGVVPGGGTTLLRLSQTEGISDLTRKALQNVFKKLVENAGLPADVKLHDVLNSKSPMGFNLRGEDKLTNLVKAGVLDPALVLQEMVKNAASTAGNVLTIGFMVLFEDKEEK